MTTRRSYTRHQKAAIVGEAEVSGIRPTARRHHMPESTIRVWRAEPFFAQLRAETRDDVAADVWATFQVGIQRIAELIPKTEDLQKVAVATGIAYDKYALISGHATSRSETTAITAGLPDERRKALRDWMDTLPSDPIEVVPE